MFTYLSPHIFARDKKMCNLVICFRKQIRAFLKGLILLGQGGRDLLKSLKVLQKFSNTLGSIMFLSTIYISRSSTVEHRSSVVHIHVCCVHKTALRKVPNMTQRVSQKQSVVSISYNSLNEQVDPGSLDLLHDQHTHTSKCVIKLPCGFEVTHIMIKLQRPTS